MLPISFSTRLYKITTVSVRARAIFYGTYCLSKFTYVATYNVVSPQDIHDLQIRVARAVLHRHWLQARHLPGVLRCLRIAPMQDLEIAFACAAVGLLERRAATDPLLRQYLCYCCDRQLETAITYLERYLPSLPHRNVTAIQQALKNRVNALTTYNHPKSYNSEPDWVIPPTRHHPDSLTLLHLTVTRETLQAWNENQSRTSSHGIPPRAHHYIMERRTIIPLAASAH